MSPRHETPNNTEKLFEAIKGGYESCPTGHRICASPSERHRLRNAGRSAEDVKKDELKVKASKISHLNSISEFETLSHGS